MRAKRLLASIPLALTLVAVPAAVAQADTPSRSRDDIVLGGGVCEDKDVIITVNNPIDHRRIARICFDWPVGRR